MAFILMAAIMVGSYFANRHLSQNEMFPRFDKYLRAWVFQPFMLGGGVSLLLMALFDSMTATGAMQSAWISGMILNHYLDIDKGKSGKSSIRGAKLASAGDVARMVEKSGEEADITIGSVPIPKKQEVQSFLFAGSPGSGKSVGITVMLDRISHRHNDRVIVADSSAIYLTRYFLKERGDAILNPFDSRSAAWSPLAEIESPMDAQAVAKSLVPDAQGDNAFFSTSAQNFMAAILVYCWKNKLCNAEIWFFATVANVEDLAPVLSGTPAQPLIQEGGERVFQSVRSTLTADLQAFSYLSPSAGVTSFSVRKFVQTSTSWLFITYDAAQLDSLKSMVSAWLDIAARSVLTLPPSSDRRIWVVVDELASLGRVQSLQNFLANARKFGGCVVAGIQSLSQLRSRYGRDVATTICDTLGTWVVLRVSDPETADYLSRGLGDEQIRRVNSSGGDGQGGGHSGWSEQVTNERIVMASEISNLPPCVGYMNIAGPLPACPIRLPYPQPYTNGMEAFQLADMSSHDMLAARSKAEPQSNGDATSPQDSQAEAQAKGVDLDF